jgi:hypothetical protein
VSDDERSDISTADLAGRSDREQAEDEPIGRARGADDGTDQIEPTVPLFPPEDGERFRARWTEIQTGFVDRPRDAVEQADTLVADLMQRLARQFDDERGSLEGQWERGDDVSTEELRVALTRYRSFFERLLAV